MYGTYSGAEIVPDSSLSLQACVDDVLHKYG